MNATIGNKCINCPTYADFKNLFDSLDLNADVSLWLSHGQEKFPSWNIMRKDNLVYLHFFPTEHDAGTHLRSASKELVTFHTDGFVFEIQKGSLTDPVTALGVIRQYFDEGTLPSNLDWEEL
jgi:hypothetical protein